MLTDRGRGLLAAGITLTLAGMTLGFEDLTRIGLSAALLPLGAGALVRLAHPRLDVETHLEGRRLHVGMASTLVVVVRPRRRSPALRLEQTMPAALSPTSPHTLIPPIGPGRKFTLTGRVTPTTRGVHVIGPTVFSHDDPFGLATRRWTEGAPRPITVLPRIHPLGDDTPSGTSLRSEGGLPAASVLPGEEHASIRAYQLGDDLRRIHWPVTAHRGELMMRHEERPVIRSTLLALDTGLLRAGALEWACELLASAADASVRSGADLSLVSPAGGVGGRVSADLDDVLMDLALARPSTSTSRLSQEEPFVEALHEGAAHAGLVILVSRATDDARHLLLTLPPGTAGLAFLVDAGPGADDAASLATDAGWGVCVVPPDMSVADAWAGALATRTARGQSR